MLRHLFIKHYALIERLEISLDDQLNILTGETGSGKSILLGAMSLLLGERADLSAVQKGQSKCIVEGTFGVGGMQLEPIFEAHDLDFDPETLIRREILASGKSRAFINDTPVNLKVLKAIGTRLVDLHSQHQTLQINDPLYQLGILDRFAHSADLLEAYRQKYEAWIAASKALGEAKEANQKLRQNIDFMKFQLAELEAAHLDDLDAEELEEQYNLLANADAISSGVSQALEATSEGEVNALAALRTAVEAMRPLSGYAEAYRELSERLASVQIEVDDIARELDQWLNKVEADPGQLAALESRRNSLFSLQQKHGVDTVEALCSLRDALSEEVNRVDGFDEELAQLERDKKAAQEAVAKSGAALSAHRQKHIADLCRGILETVAALNMPDAAFEVKLEPLDKPSPQGMDKAVFYFSANAGHAPAPLREVASGGELSRLMLAVKAMSSKSGQRPTIVFDEIDTGVSGEVAHSMGRIMKQMAAGTQLLCITHLPQIAAKGNAHFKVYKTQVDGRAQTRMSQLAEADRVEEIAQMLSGARTTAAALTNAKELLGQE